MEQKEQTLVEHYQTLDNIRTDFRNANLFALVASLVTGKTVVDVGCGSGFLTNLMLESGREVVGIEPNEGLRKLASELNPRAKIIPGMAEDITSTVTAPVESVVMTDVLEHIEDDGEQVRKVSRVLATGGQFVIVVPAYPSLYGKRDEGMGHYRRYSKRALEKVLTENGFRVTKIRYWNALGVLPYLVAEKILKRPLRAEFRGSEKVGFFSRAVRTGLFFWFRYVENNCNFYFGLSIIAVAKKV